MNVLFDFGAIKTGGGVQLSVNFLDLLDRLKPADLNVFVLIPEVGALSKLPLAGKYAGVFVSPNSFAKRFIFEYVQLQRLIRQHNIQHIFTFFGAGLPHPQNVRSVVTVAYPIICYPESPYWSHISNTEDAYIRCLNILRRRRLRSASMILAETAIMKTRLARSLHFPTEQIYVLPPTPSQFVEPLKTNHLSSIRRFLFISGNDSHKNLWRLPAVAQCLRNLGSTNFLFVLTSSREAYLNSLKDSGVQEELINTHFSFLGPIPPQRIMEAYNQADVVVSLSDLESFSNNYMEAWKARLPLLASDRDFSRHICQDSAIYADPHNPAEVADQLFQLAKDPALRNKLVQAGIERLSTLPSQEERLRLALKYIFGNTQVAAGKKLSTQY